MLKYLASIPVVLSVIAGAYGTLNYVNNYADAREELVKEMAEMASWVGRLEGILYALRDGSYKLASQAEYQALEELVRGNTDSLRQIGYDIKEIERVASGGY